MLQVVFDCILKLGTAHLGLKVFFDLVLNEVLKEPSIPIYVLHVEVINVLFDFLLLVQLVLMLSAKCTL